MSGNTKWIVGGIALVGLLLYYGGVLGVSTQDDQVASVSSSGSGSDITNAGIARDVVAIDARLKAFNLSGGAGVNAPALQKMVRAMSALQSKLDVRIANLPKVSTGLKSTFSDLSVQLANASSESASAAQTSITVTQGKQYIQLAYANVLQARKDIGAIIAQLPVQ